MSDISIDLSPIIRHIDVLSQNLDVVNNNIGVVGENVAVVAQQQEATKDRLEDLYAEFKAFVAADIKHKQHQLAATRIIEVHQEIEKRFGHYAEVRRASTGILQATDVAIIREETMRSATENLMISTPGYWLAPALVALTSWIADNQSLAQKALTEALHRDDSKTSLFFSLICRRARRMEATGKWLARYFQNQNPMAMDREVVIMLDSLANGVFGGAALAACSSVIDEWLEELEQQAGFAEDQCNRWSQALDIMTPKVRGDEYPTLRQNSKTWPRLETSLAAARRNQIVQIFFEQLFTGEVIAPRSLEAAADTLLDTLVTKFDVEELPLRREERLLQLLVEEEGDKDAAHRRFAAESTALDEKTSFAAVLTNSAMTPEHFGATRATQRYAISQSRQWILNAHNDLVARDRSQMPADISLACGSWESTTRDGSNEDGLVRNLTEHYEGRIKEAEEAVKLSPGVWITLVAGLLLGMLMVRSVPLIALVVAGAAVAIFFWQKSQLDSARKAARELLEEERDRALKILRACLAESADLRRELAREDAKATKVAEFLEALSSPQFVLMGPERSRSVA